MNQTNSQNLHKEIDLIQNCIKRMATNSFLLKGWTISLVAVVLVLSEKIPNPYFLGLVILVPLISFWYLDAFFLYKERLYRKMYEWVIAERPKGNNKNMYNINTEDLESKLKVKKRNKKTNKKEDTDKIETVRTVMWSNTLRCFYLIPIILVLFIMTGFLVTTYVGKSANKEASAPHVQKSESLVPAEKDTQHLLRQKRTTTSPQEEY